MRDGSKWSWYLLVLNPSVPIPTPEGALKFRPEAISYAAGPRPRAIVGSKSIRPQATRPGLKSEVGTTGTLFDIPTRWADPEEQAHK